MTRRDRSLTYLLGNPRIEASRCHRAGLVTWRASKQTGAAA